MAKLGQSYNSESNNAGMESREALPAGDYVMVVSKSEYKENKKRTGHYLSLWLKVVIGQARGRLAFELLNLDNPNPIAVDIANKTLNSICKACGKASVEDSDELHGVPMTVTLKVSAGDAANPPRNEVVAYKPYDGEIDTADIAPAQAPAQAKTTDLPWDE